MNDSALGLGLMSRRGWLFSRSHLCNARIQSFTACGLLGGAFISMIGFGGHSMGLWSTFNTSRLPKSARYPGRRVILLREMHKT